MRKAVFLDRDGILNRDRGEYTFRQEDFSLLPGVLSGLKKLIASGYELVIITNQGGIAKGLYSNEDVESLHENLMESCNDNGIDLLAIYYCPHHPDHGMCLCRKPGSLLIEKAIARFDIDRSSSFMIGDMDRDIQAAAATGVRGILAPTNSNFEDTLNQFPWHESLNS